MQENVVVEVPGMFHVLPFLHAAGPRSRHRHRLTAAHRANMPRDDYSPGRGAVTRQETRGPSSDLVAQVVSHLYDPGRVGWWYGFLPRPARSRAVSFLSSSGSNSNSTQASLQTACLLRSLCGWIGRPPHAMPCNASIARAVAYRQGTGGRGVSSGISRALIESSAGTTACVRSTWAYRLV